MAAYTTIDDPTIYMNPVLWTGNDTTATAITGVGFQPDMTWIKERSQVRSHVLFDVVRGATVQLNPNGNALDATVAESLQSFDADGFTVGDATSVNESGETYVGWNWKETADAGFDIVTATGTGSAKTINHSLSAVPDVIFSKEKTGSVNDWAVYHHKNTSAPETEMLILNETNATSDQTCWNDTLPTSSVFSVGTTSVTNRSSSTYVYYLWAEKQGFSKFGSYEGNGADTPNGVFIYLGFSPAFILIKATDINSWVMVNNKSPGYNPVDNSLSADSTAAEVTGDSNTTFDFLSNGFRTNGNSGNNNSSGQKYIYMAFAEAPFVNSNGVPCNAK